MMPNVKEVLITSQEIEEKVREIGARITEDYRGENPLLIGVLRGAVAWIPLGELGEGFKVDGKTEKILRLEVARIS